MRLALLALTLSSSAALADAPKAAVVGTIKGTVLFEGEPPERATLDRTSDLFCVTQVATATADAVVVTRGKLAGVLIRIKNGSTGTHAAPATPAVIDQVGCAYSPHVIGIVAGQKITVRNSDGTSHNVHGKLKSKELLNKMQAEKGPDIAVDAPAVANDVIELTCGVHPWMHAFAVVQDHPYFAVTGTDGAFTITGMPSGTYTLEAWHPTLGAKSMTVKIGMGAKASINARFSYKP
ncbi:methylamine utilization protein [soil metagenome]